MTLQRTSAEAALAADYAARRPVLFGATKMRDDAMARFLEAGLPNRRVEEWHYTDLRARMNEAAPLRSADAAAIGAARERLTSLELGEAIVVVMLDGEFNLGLSSIGARPQGVEIGSLATALLDPANADLIAPPGLGEADSIVSLNAAFVQGGAFIRIPANMRVERPIALVNLLSGGPRHAAYTRSFIELGVGASATVWEISENSGGETQANDALVIKLGDLAECDHIAQVHHRGEKSIAVHTLLATMGRSARFDSFALVKDTGFVRRQMFARLEREESHIGLRGLSLLRGEEHADTTLVIDHAAGHCESREFYRTILDGSATGVFQGKVCVRQGAQKTDGGMKSQALMLSDDATMYNKPELEIFADDVVCGHGATVGQLDDNQIFYLQSRGLSRAEAQSMLLQAFAQEALDHIADETLRERFASEAHAWLSMRSKA
ncbi:MAG: Fe-S cluster assembly protein SufD [Hyphomicrobiales bacterium]|nr:Fe-S cluster assembly protein SufD [Hyphomicrobiales bacterium]